MFLKKSPRKLLNRFSNSFLWTPLLHQYNHLVPGYQTSYPLLNYNTLRAVTFSPANTLSSYAVACLSLEAGPRETGLLAWVLAGHETLGRTQSIVQQKAARLAAEAVDASMEVETDLTYVAANYIDESVFTLTSGLEHFSSSSWFDALPVRRPVRRKRQKSLRRRFKMCVKFRDREVTVYNQLLPWFAEVEQLEHKSKRRLYPRPGIPLRNSHRLSMEWPSYYFSNGSNSLEHDGSNPLYEGLTSLNSVNTLAVVTDYSKNPWAFCDTPEGIAYFKELGKVFPLFKTPERLRKLVTRPRKKNPLPYSPTSDDDNGSPYGRLSFLACLEPFIYGEDEAEPWATQPADVVYRIRNPLVWHRVSRRSALWRVPKAPSVKKRSVRYPIFVSWLSQSRYYPVRPSGFLNTDPRWRKAARAKTDVSVFFSVPRLETPIRTISAIEWLWPQSHFYLNRTSLNHSVQGWWDIFNFFFTSLRFYRLKPKKLLRFNVVQFDWVRYAQATYRFSASEAMYPLYTSLTFYTRLTQYHLHHLALCAAGRFVRAHCQGAQYNFYWNFQGRRLFLTLHNDGDVRYNYFFLSPGLFLKYFRYQKCLKKTKLMKLLVVKYARKLLLVSQIVEIHFWVRGVPSLFSELFRVFFTPVVTPFKHPLTMQPYYDVEETKKQTPFFPISITHNRTKPYNYMKVKRRGRLKRKVMRRLMSKSRVCD